MHCYRKILIWYNDSDRYERMMNKSFIRERDMNRKLTAIVEREGDGYVALCPEVDVASQGNTVAKARNNLEEALTLFFKMAPVEEVEKRLRSEVYVTHVEIAVG